MSVVNIKLYEFARKEMNLSEDKAKEFVQAIDEVVKGNRFNKITIEPLVKDEIHSLHLSTYKTIFWPVLIQFLAIAASIFGIINFMFHK